MKIEIIGAGLAGLATASLAQKAGHEVRVVSHGILASTVAAGLMHPYGGLRAKLNRFGLEGMEAALALIPKRAILQKGIIRLAVDPSLDFKESTLPRLSPEEIQVRNPGVANVFGLWIEEGYMIDIKSYLEHLAKDFKIEKERSSWGDVTVWAIGAHSEHVKKVKGQLLKLKMKNPGIHDAINAHCYVVPQKDGLLVGATFERDTLDWECDVAKAKSLLYPKLKQIIPSFDESMVEGIECAAGLRATTPDHLPLLKQLDSKNWLFSGLGSKGLLYHALYAQKLLTLLQTRS